MIDQKYADLMNAEIDGVASDEERRELREYTERTPEARQVFDDLRQTARLLDETPTVDPPPHLFHRIIDAVPFGRRPAAAPASTSMSWLQWLVARPRIAHVTTFALGLAVGATVFYAVITGRDGRVPQLNLSDLSGAMKTIEQSEDLATVGEIGVDHGGVTGHVRLHETGTTLLADVALNSVAEIDWTLEFGTDDVTLEGFRQVREGDGEVAIADAEMRVRQRGDNRYILFFSHADGRTSAMTIRIVSGGQVVLKQSLTGL